MTTSTYAGGLPFSFWYVTEKEMEVPGGAVRGATTGSRRLVGPSTARAGPMRAARSTVAAAMDRQSRAYGTRRGRWMIATDDASTPGMSSRRSVEHGRRYPRSQWYGRHPDGLRRSRRCRVAPAHRVAAHHPKSGCRTGSIAIILGRMQILTPRRDDRLRATTPAGVATHTAVAGSMLVAAVAVAWLDLATPLLRTLQIPVRPTVAEAVVAVVAWAAALGLPAVLLVVGAVRLLDVADGLTGLHRQAGPNGALAAQLGDGYVVCEAVRLPDGSAIPRIVLGPHGLAVLEVTPPRSATRHRDGRWELRLRDGRWVAMENPLDRTSRDAERVRRWCAADDRDFVVRVHAALVVPDASIQRTPTCAVIAADQIPSWIGSLPAQRTLTPGRRARLARMLVERI